MKSLNRRNNRRGTMMMEFMLLGIPIVFLTLSVFEVSLMMWQYVTMDQTVQSGTQYISVHGTNCTLNGNNCTITVGNIASYIEGVDVGLDDSKLNITLYSGPPGATPTTTVTCNPVTTCTGNSTTFPPLTDNAVGNDVRVQATYAMNNPIVMFWPSQTSVSTGVTTLGATSTQRIVF
jgi:Flp pilus assembly protein TadG